MTMKKQVQDNINVVEPKNRRGQGGEQSDRKKKQTKLKPSSILYHSQLQA